MRIFLLAIIALIAFANCATANDEFVMIPGGTFNMGSPKSENWRGNDETQHEVTIGDFYISKYELTQGEYKALTGENPSSFKGD
ncbi:MAG: SUMF1/EgtB/PvdO family nonheme iron enzyme, partial [Synergistaceae bacterium]|nr:SUMF1/EgtB/PvdO family nonheme iron enzyme [Synergistaceae bacterium]